MVYIRDSGAELSSALLEDNAVGAGRDVVVLARIIGSVINQGELEPRTRATAQSDTFRGLVVVLVIRNRATERKRNNLCKHLGKTTGKNLAMRAA